MSETSVIQHCEICNCLLPLPLIKHCGRCMDLSDNIDMLATRSEKARAALLGMLLTPSMAKAILEMENTVESEWSRSYTVGNAAWLLLVEAAEEITGKTAEFRS